MESGTTNGGYSAILHICVLYTNCQNAKNCPVIREGTLETPPAIYDRQDLSKVTFSYGMVRCSSDVGSECHWRIQTNWGGQPSLPSPTISFPSLPLKVGPLNTTRRLGERCKFPSGVWGRAPAEIEFGTF